MISSGYRALPPTFGCEVDTYRAISDWATLLGNYLPSRYVHTVPLLLVGTSQYLIT